MTTISLRIPDELNEVLQKVAHEEERSKSFLIKKAIKSYLEDLQDYNLAQKGYQRYLDDNQQGVSIEDLAKNLGMQIDKA